MEIKTTFKFYNDNEAPYFGAYKTGSLTNGEPTLMFCMDAAISVVKDVEDKSETFKDLALSTITHEFCHSMQEWLGKEFDELEVEKILGAYNERWNVFNAEPAQEDEPVFRINDLLAALDTMELDKNYSDHYHNGAKMMKDKVRDIFAPYLLWHEAEKKNKQEKQP